MLPPLLRQLAGYDYWANGKVLEAVLASEALSARHLYQKASRLFNHMINVQSEWAGRMQSSFRETATGGLPVFPLSAQRPLADEQRWLTAFSQQLQQLTTEHQENDPVFTYTNTKGIRYSNRLSEILLHLSHHGHYHRGQINQLLRDMGTEPVPVDFIYFLRQQHEV